MSAKQLAISAALAAAAASVTVFAQQPQQPGAPAAQPPGPGPGPGAAKKGPPGSAARQSQLYGDELFTPQERQAFFDKMKAAKTPEERDKLRAERRAVAETRAKEKGITLPEPPPRAPGGPPPAAPKAQ